MASPELRPGLLPLLQTEDEELYGPEDSPRAMCEVAGNVLSVRHGYRDLVLSRFNIQHAIRLLPSQVMLNVYRRLRLDGKTEQRHN